MSHEDADRPDDQDGADPRRDPGGDVAPDPTRATTVGHDVDAAADDGATGLPSPDPTRDAVPRAADLPADASADSVPAPDFGPGFGLDEPEPHSWVPQRAASAAAAPPTAPPTSDAGGPADRPGANPVSRIQPWHVVAVAAGVLVPLAVWAAAALNAADEPLVTQPTRRPSVVRSIQIPPSLLTPQLPPQTRIPGTGLAPGTSPTSRPQQTRLPQTAPPTLLPAPKGQVTPIPTDARTIRFEAFAEGGASLELSLSDATHQRHDFPSQRGSAAFEVPVPQQPTSNDYLSLRARTSYTSSTDRPDVSCRILVDGIVVVAQQGQGYVTCYISPYYDLRRS